MLKGKKEDHKIEEGSSSKRTTRINQQSGILFAFLRPPQITDASCRAKTALQATAATEIRRSVISHRRTPDFQLKNKGHSFLVDVFDFTDPSQNASKAMHRRSERVLPETKDAPAVR